MEQLQTCANHCGKIVLAIRLLWVTAVTELSRREGLPRFDSPSMSEFLRTTRTHQTYRLAAKLNNNTVHLSPIYRCVNEVVDNFAMLGKLPEPSGEVLNEYTVKLKAT